MAEAALTVGGDAYLLWRAGVAGEGDDVDQRGFVVLFRLCGLLDAVGGEADFGGGAQGQAAREAETLGYDGALEKDVMAVLCILAGDDLVWQSIYPREVPALICQPGDLCEHLTPEIINDAVNTSHVMSSCGKWIWQLIILLFRRFGKIKMV